LARGHGPPSYWPIGGQRVAAFPVDLAAIEQTPIDKGGNVPAAARALNVPSDDLRRLVRATPSLVDAAFEQIEQALDRAQAVLREELSSDDFNRRLKAAVFILRRGEAARLRVGACASCFGAPIGLSEPEMSAKRKELARNVKLGVDAATISFGNPPANYPPRFSRKDTGQNGASSPRREVMREDDVQTERNPL
jgi:hypothetical protein